MRQEHLEKSETEDMPHASQRDHRGLSAVFTWLLSVWLVGKQGQAYREGLRSDRIAAASA